MALSYRPQELIVDDDEVLRNIRAVCKDGDKTVQFGLANMLVNITNSYDKPEETEERKQMRQLGGSKKLRTVLIL